MTSDAESDFAHEDDSEVIRLASNPNLAQFRLPDIYRIFLRTIIEEILIFHLRLEEYSTSCL